MGATTAVSAAEKKQLTTKQFQQQQQQNEKNQPYDGTTLSPKRKCLLLFFTVLETLLSAVPIGGWSSLVFVLVEEGFYSDLCGDSAGNYTIVKDEGLETSTCLEQNQKLDLLYTVGTFASTGIASFLSGVAVDKFGGRTVRVVGSCMYGFSSVLFAFAGREGKQDLLFPAIFFHAFGGTILYYSVMPVASMFDRWKSTVLSLYIGGATSSAVLFLIFKILYENGVPYTILFYSQLGFAAMVLFNTIFLYPETHHNDHQQLQQRKKSIPSPKDCISGQMNKKNVIVSTDCTSLVTTKSEITEKKVVPLETSGSCPLTPLFTFKKATCSLLFFWIVAFFTICRFRLIFFLGIFKRFMESFPDSTPDNVSTYTNVFGFIQFSAMFITPISGLLMDSRSKPSRKEDCTYLTDPEKAKAVEAGYMEPWYVEKIRDALRLPRMGGELLRYIRITSLTTFLCLLFSVFVLIPSLNAQIFAFILYVIVRSFSMSCSLSLYVLIFPRKLHGKLIGLTSLISAAVMLLQYPILRLVDQVFDGDILLTDISLLILTILALGLPVYLWYHARRNFHRVDEHTKTSDFSDDEMRVVCIETVL